MEILLLLPSNRLLSSKRVGKAGAHSWRVADRILVVSTVCYTAGSPVQRLGEVCPQTACIASSCEKDASVWEGLLLKPE